MPGPTHANPASARTSQPERAPFVLPAPDAQLRLCAVSRSFGERRVLTDVSLTVSSGERVGLIGENGSGKSTLLRLAAGLIAPDAGSVSVTGARGVTPRVALLHQEPPFAPQESVAQALDRALAPVHAALRALDDAAHALAAIAPPAPVDHAEPDGVAAHLGAAQAAAYATALERAEALEVWDTEARVETMLAGLGLADLDRSRPTSSLSGGERARLALAWVLLSGPDVLLLDEPTNHLDDVATTHLTRVLNAWRGPVLLASHDRAFLDESVTTLVDLDPSALPHAVAGPLVAQGDGSGIGLVRFTGSYTDYLAARLDARERWERRYAEEQAELKRLRVQVHASHLVGHPGREPRTEARGAKKFYADRNARVVSRRVTDARARLEQLEADQIRKPPPPLWFRGLAAGDGAEGHAGARPRWSGPVLTAAAVSVAGRLAPTSLTVSASERWLVTGPNGCGKSTLLALLARRLEPTSGAVNAPRGLRVGLLTQDVALPDPERRGPERTARQAYEDLVGAERAERTPLGTFGLLPGREENRPLATMSVGQQRRLALAVVLADPPDVLLLDEPTNHLSLLLVAQLEAQLADTSAFGGAIVVASHDRWLRRGWRGRTLTIG